MLEKLLTHCSEPFNTLTFTSIDKQVLLELIYTESDVMQITSFWPLFFFAVGVQGVFLSLILFLKREANKSNFHLALLIALFSISIIDTLTFWTTCSCEDPYWPKSKSIYN